MESKTAVFINESKDKQALVPIQSGDYISKAFEDKHGIALSVFRIDDISPMENTAIITPVYRKSSLVNEYIIDQEYQPMVEETVDKLKSSRIIAIMKKTQRNERD